MSDIMRSASLGAKPKPRMQRPSRAESAAAVAMDVRCACQFFETKSLLPERVNPVGYDTSNEFEPCMHVQAHLKDERLRTPPQSPYESAFIPTVSSTGLTTSGQSIPRSAQEIPPEFLPDHLAQQLAAENIMSSAQPFATRSVSYSNMGRLPQAQFMRQRDPSTSSLLRKRMSEDRMSATLDKNLSQLSASKDRFITQKDPSQSTILRRKSSFDRASSERPASEHNVPFTFHQSRIPNERTFYHDSNDLLRDSNMEYAQPVSSESTKVERAAPLSMESKGNRRFVMSSTENLPQQAAKIAATIQNAMGMDIDDELLQLENSRNLQDLDDLEPQQTDAEKLRLTHDRNVSDEEKVQALLSKTQTQPAIDEKENLSMVKPKRGIKNRKMTLCTVEAMEAIECPVQTKIQIQYVPKMDNTLNPSYAETSDYSDSKLFDNYQLAGTPNRTPMNQTPNVSTPDLRTNYIKQRDPSQSAFTRNRYRTPTPVTSSIEAKPNTEKLLPPAGDYPERRASEISNRFIQQKDLRLSNVLNRRRRNLSQTSLGNANEVVDSRAGAPVKMVKTISFEKNLSQPEHDHMMAISPSTRIVKGVSFEYAQSLMNQQQSVQNQNTALDSRHKMTNRPVLR